MEKLRTVFVNLKVGILLHLSSTVTKNTECYILLNNFIRVES